MDTQKTFIISGNFRGGTTAVAQLLARAGIFLGEEMDSHGNSEDSAFQRLLVRPDLDSDELVRLIESRNQSHPIWGFKFPGAHTFMPGMLPYFRNPLLIFVFRDPIAVADSESRRAGQNFGEMMQRTARFNSNMVELMKLLPNRSHAISYELLLARTSEVVENLLDFMEFKVSASERMRLIASIKPCKDPFSSGYSRTKSAQARKRRRTKQESNYFAIWLRKFASPLVRSWD